MLLLVLLIPIAFLLVFVAAPLFLLLRWLWRRTRADQPLVRALIIWAGVLLLASPYIGYKIFEHRALLAPVPEPLEVAEVEYQLEQYDGIGGWPGDNETGFIVYRLTDASSEWARGRGTELSGALAGGAALWKPTPVDDVVDHDEWHLYDRARPLPKPHPPTVIEFLHKYGFSIDVDKRRAAEVDRAIQAPGSFYSYGDGGSVTVVDPAGGKVYYFYAG